MNYTYSSLSKLKERDLKELTGALEIKVTPGQKKDDVIDAVLEYQDVLKDGEVEELPQRVDKLIPTFPVTYAVESILNINELKGNVIDQLMQLSSESLLQVTVFCGYEVERRGKYAIVNGINFENPKSLAQLLPSFENVVTYDNDSAEAFTPLVPLQLAMQSVLEFQGLRCQLLQELSEMSSTVLLEVAERLGIYNAVRGEFAFIDSIAVDSRQALALLLIT